MRDNFKYIVKDTARVIRKHGQITRHEIADQLPVSVMTVGKAVGFLCENNMVVENIPSASGAGRKAGILSLTGAYCVVIDISTRNFTLDIFEISGKKVTSLTHRYSDKALFEENMYMFFDRAKVFCKERLSEAVPIRIGMIVPGKYDYAGDKVYFDGDMDFIGIRPMELMRGAFGDLPVVIEEDISIGAVFVAESFSECDNLIYMRADFPLGAVLISNGRAIKGAVGGIGFYNYSYSLHDINREKLYLYMPYVEKARMFAGAIAGYMTVFSPDAVIIERADGSDDDGFTETIKTLLVSEFFVKPELCPRIIRFTSEKNGRKNGVLSVMFENWLDETVK